MICDFFKSCHQVWTIVTHPVRATWVDSMLIADDFPELGPNLVATLTSLWGVKIRNCNLSRWLIIQALLWYIAKTSKEIASISSGIVKIYIN